MDTISVVIPLFNKKPHIGRAIASVLAQTSPADEIIVVDDGSTDGGGEVVKAFDDDRIKFLRQENQGVSAARNRGIDAATGELIAFLDADDAWKPGYLATIRKLRQEYPEAGIYGTAYEIIKPDGSLFHHQFKVLPSGRTHGLIDNIFKNGIPQPIWTSATVIPKEVLIKYGGFKVGDLKGQDLELWIRITIDFPAAWHGEELAIYYQDAINRVHEVTKFKQEPAYCVTIREALQAGAVPPEKLKDFREYAAHWQYYAVGHLLITGQKDVALKIINDTKGTRLYLEKGWILHLLAHLPTMFSLILREIIRKYNKLCSVKAKIEKMTILVSLSV